MNYTVRYAHLSNIYVKKGDVLHYGDLIGRMGSTGQSTAAHLHIDLVHYHIDRMYHMYQIPYMLSDVQDALQQLGYFIDEDLFKTEPLITTYWGDPRYKIHDKWKFHPGYDVVPADRKSTDEHYNVYYNRTVPAEVSALFDDPSYGLVVFIKYTL